MQAREIENGNLAISVTNSKIYYPTGRYNSSGEYLWFNNISVEPRERVKYMSLRYGVPVSSQWNKNGHLYPVQVAQFGLSHFSKLIAHESSSRKRIPNPEPKQLQFIVKDKIKFIHHENENAEVNLVNNGFEFKFPGIKNFN